MSKTAMDAADLPSLYDYKRFAILYVDDEEMSLKYFRMAFEDKYRVLTASNAADGYKLLETHKDEIGLLMTDQRMPGEKGVQLLEKARQLRPRIIRILATAYADMDAAIAAVNTGAIYKYVSKPWEVHDLDVVLRRGLEFFMVQRERDQLLHEKLAVLHNMMITDRVISLGLLAAGLGHHVRNSLVAVRTFLDLAPSKLEEEAVDLEELRNPNFWREFYDHVQTQLARIGELLGQLTSVARDEPDGFPDELDVKQALQEVLQAQSGNFARTGITTENLMPAGLPVLHCDARKIGQLFHLLIADELTTLPSGSRLKVGAARQPGENGQPEQIVIEISDNGPGLPVEQLRMVFDPFFARSGSPQDFGINLMTCYFIVYHHGGTISIRRSPEGGNLFTIKLPVQPHPLKSPEEGKDFLSKVMLNDTLWERLLAGV